MRSPRDDCSENLICEKRVSITCTMEMPWEREPAYLPEGGREREGMGERHV